jgi:LPS O-antigen subunit length determinant protein (WzzB/FepE family)
MPDDEIELIDYINVIRKKKWMIIIGTLSLMIVVGIGSFLVKPVYEVDAIIQPGKLWVETQGGNITEVVVEDPQQIADKVQHQSFDSLIVEELDIDDTKLPKIKGEFIRNTLLTRVWLRSSEVELGKKALDALIRYLKEDMDTKIDVEINNIDTDIALKENEINSKQIEINSKQIEKERITKEIGNLRNKLKIIDNRKEGIGVEMKEVRKRIESIEKEQADVLRKEKKTESETLALLLYSNEIQKNLQFYNDLQEQLAAKELDEEDINIDIENRKGSIKQLDNEVENVKNEIEELKSQISNLKERKGRIDYTKIVKAPQASTYPVWPKKKIYVIVVGLLGLIFFTFLGFLSEYVKRQKDRS